MIAMGYARINGFGYAFGDASDCGAGEHWDPVSESCFACDPGWVYSAAQNTCVQAGGGGSKPPAPAPAPAPGGGDTPAPGGGTSTASAKASSLVPWAIGGAALLGIVYFAAKSKQGRR